MNPSIARRILVAAALCAAATACARGADAPPDGPPETDVAAEIARRIEVRESPAIFTLFAMLNAGGYDEENYREMHPVRRAVRSALPRLLPDSVFARVEAYYRAHARDADPWAYSVVTLATSGPPDFTPTEMWTRNLAQRDQFGRLADLPAMLRMFHRAFPVDSLYRVHQLAYRAYIADYTSAIRREVAAAIRYARVTDAAELVGGGERGRAVVIPNLLLSYERAFSFALSDTLYSIEGPQPVIGYNPHEFVHAITNPLSYDSAQFSALQRSAEPAWLAVRTRPAIARFETLAAYLDESLVRAVTLRYAAARQPARDSAYFADAAADARAGFVLVPYFYERLKAYERQDAPLRAYYPKLFESLDAAAEAARWTNANSGSTS